VPFPEAYPTSDETYRATVEIIWEWLAREVTNV
jgi:hypothetical protein